MMTIKQSLRQWVDARGPHLRLAAYRLVIMTGRPVDTGILRQLAVDLEAAGSIALAVHCWDLVHRFTPYAPDTLVDHLPGAVATGEMARVRWFARQARRLVGFPPGHTAWLAGMLSCHGHHAEAGRVLASFAASPAEMRRIVAQFPSVVLELVPKDLSTLARALQSMPPAPEDAAATLLDLARLCFTFRKMEQAACLYREVYRVRALSALDRAAMLYASARTGPAAVVADCGPGELGQLAHALEQEPDALTMLAYVALVAEDAGLAAAAVERAVRAKYAAVDGIDGIVEDCIAMLGAIDRLRAGPPMRLGEESFDVSVLDGRAGVPKVFVCGFGWSGSGAVYDDIRGVEGFSEFEGAGDAPLLNADSGTEATFIQADAGLGDTWMAAKGSGRLAWQRLWDMLCLHVLGLSGIGYNDYKSCAAAANNLRRHGAAYVRPFRVFMQGCEELQDAPARGAAARLFANATESLCRMLLERQGGRAVLFNNAVFGRAAAMLRIFTNYRAVVVFRDPLDVYVDRRNQDKNHWRSPRLFADLYGSGLRRYVAYRSGDAWPGTGNLREVPFERFVLDAGFRRAVRAWLLSGGVGGGDDSCFDPAASRRNVGMHRKALDAKSRAQLQAMSATYREMERLADEAWGPERGAGTT